MENFLGELFWRTNLENYLGELIIADQRVTRTGSVQLQFRCRPDVPKKVWGHRACLTPSDRTAPGRHHVTGRTSGAHRSAPAAPRTEPVPHRPHREPNRHRTSPWCYQFTVRLQVPRSAQVRTEPARSATSSPGASRCNYSSGAARWQVRYDFQN